MLSDVLISLANWHLHFGLIGIDEFKERFQVALWLDREGDGPDPRESQGEDGPDQHRYEGAEGSPDERVFVRRPKEYTPENEYLELIWFGWVFTRQDPDPYPSTPHGHDGSPNKRWPKLNPYTGRVFKGKHQEEEKRRLNKKRMVMLWSNPEFRDFCRSHVLWYMEAHPHYDFPVMHPLRFPRF